MKPNKSWLYRKTVVLTGASDGIGKELTLRLVRDFDCKVIGIARSIDKLSALKKSLGEKSSSFSFISADVSNGDFWSEFSSSLISSDATIDILINNAGIMPPFIPLKKTDEQTFKRTIEVNLYSAYYSSYALMPILKKSKFGSIINISSSASVCPLPGTAVYSASKSALNAMTIALASEERDLYISYIRPGFTKTNLFSKNGDIFDSKIVSAFSTSVQKMANKILKGIHKKKKRMLFGKDAYFMAGLHKIAPTSSAPIIKSIMKLSHLPVFTELFNDEEE